MSKINSYKKDTNITLQDKLIGTDIDENGETKNYTFEDIMLFLNENGFNNVATPQVLKVQKTTITSSQILTLNTIPVNILDSSENGKVKYPTSMYIYRQSGNAYSLVANSFSIINDFGTSLSSNLNPSPMLSNSEGYFQSYVSVNQNLSGGKKNMNYFLKASTGNPTNGSGSLEVYVTYCEIDVS